MKLTGRSAGSMVGKTQRNIEPESALTFRNAIREARLQVLADAEDFQPLVWVIERLANHLVGEATTLHKAKNAFLTLFGEEPHELSSVVCESSRLSAGELYDLVRHARNDAVHEGVFARNLAQHLIQLSVLLEDALVDKATSPKIRHYMISGPQTAEPWEQVGFVRQRMLANSYSHIPVRIGNSWKIVSDHGIAVYLWGSGDDSAPEKERVKSKLSCRLECAINPTSGELAAECAKSVSPEDEVKCVLQKHGDYIKRGLPLLVEAEVRASGDSGDGAAGGENLLVGIVTAFDLLFAPSFGG